MVVELMLIALILVLCIIADKFSGKFGMPALILFIGIGMLFGSDGTVSYTHLTLPTSDLV